MGRVWAKKFELGREPFFFKNVFWLPWQGKCPKTQAILPYIHVFHFPDHSSSRWSFWGVAEVFPVYLDFTFWLLASFFPWMGGRFCSAGDWVVFPTFLSCWCIFPFTFLWFHEFLPWLGRAIHIFDCLSDYWPHAQAIWDVFSLLRVVLTDKLQDRVFFSILWSVFAVTFGAV